MAQQWRMYVLSGSLLAAALAGFLLGGSSGRIAVAQGPAPPAGRGRYQITSFVIQNITPGAYILDTHSGEVFQVVGKDPPVAIGSVAKAKAKE
jgi:hypothetical protein